MSLCQLMELNLFLLKPLITTDLAQTTFSRSYSYIVTKFFLFAPDLISGHRHVFFQRRGNFFVPRLDNFYLYKKGNYSLQDA
jgi:hypothetical protein